MENFRYDTRLACRFQLQLVIFLFPTAAILLLIFPLCWKAGAGFCLDIIPPHVLRATPIRPDVFARDTACVTPDALVEMKHH